MAENLFNLEMELFPRHNSSMSYEMVTPRTINASLDDPGESGTGFFDTYFSMPRFATETTLAVLSIVVNLTVLLAIRRTQTHRTGTVYNALFVNLVVGNIFTCALSWLCNNILFLFEIPILKLIFFENRICTVFVYLMAGTSVSSAFGVVSTLTMLGFATVQYLAICKPLEHLSLVTRSRLLIFIALSWITSIVLGCSPFIVLLIISERSKCTQELLGHIMRMTIIGSNTSIAIVAAIFIVIVVLCCRIYGEVKLLQKRLSRFRFEQDVNYERKAFITTIILLGTLTFFFLPYTIVYIVSLNKSENRFGQNSLLIYYMMLLPYLKFLLDPVIYGARMREVREACFRISRQCGFKDCFCWVRDMTATTTPIGTCSIQLRNMPSYPPAPI